MILRFQEIYNNEIRDSFIEIPNINSVAEILSSIDSFMPLNQKSILNAEDSADLLRSFLIEKHGAKEINIETLVLCGHHKI